MSVAVRIAVTSILLAACADSVDSIGTDDQVAGDSPFTGECPADLFVEPAASAANSGYDAPSVAASCSTDSLVVESNGIIGYEYIAMTPNGLSEQNYRWSIPLDPVWLDTPTDLALLGTVGVTINGLPIFGPNEAERPDPYGDPVYNGLMDDCLGHTGPGGTYHYHAIVVACLTAATPANQPDPVIGYSFDGYPIYGPKGCLDEACTEVVEFESGWVQTGDPTTYAWDNHEYQGGSENNVLDECNGRFGPDGTYRYHATSTFPYILGCHHGEPTGS